MRGRAIQRENPSYKIETVSKVYADVNQKRGPAWYDCENWEIPTRPPDGYEIAEWIGSGKYSDVFCGYKGTEKVALKVMKPVRAQKYNREAKVLLNLKGGTNICTLKEIIQTVGHNQDAKRYIFVFEFVEAVEWNVLYPNFSDIDARIYLFQLLRALQFAHSRGIMHRDVKPQNIMYDPSTKKLRLIDWGLAEFYQPKSHYNIHVASKHFKPIELLVDYQCYDYSLDIWGFGVTMCGIIFGKTPFFRGSDDFDMAAKIVGLLGRTDFDAYIKKYGIQLPDPLVRALPKTPQRKDLHTLVSRSAKSLANDDAIDLIDKCLRYDHMERITAEEALAHPYFNPIRGMKLPN